MTGDLLAILDSDKPAEEILAEVRTYAEMEAGGEGPPATPAEPGDSPSEPLPPEDGGGLMGKMPRKEAMEMAAGRAMEQHGYGA